MTLNINGQEYLIISELGKGGNGQVFKVQNKKDKKYYAMKKISIEYLNEKEIEMIENEAKILSSIDSEYIVKYYDSSKESKTFYILMEYCQGSDLKKYINNFKERKDLIKEKIIYKIILELCLGIKKIHDNNLIHRDFKPENLFISEGYNIKIGDFGISKQLDPNNKYAKTYVGTNNYMAPEVIKGEKYNNKVDIWALGCIIYELFTLEVCFESKSLYGFVDKIINKPHGKININNYNSKWQDLIDLLLKKDYRERPNINEVYKSIIDFNSIDKNILTDDSNNDNKKEWNNIKMVKESEIIELKKQGKKKCYLSCKKNLKLFFD